MCSENEQVHESLVTFENPFATRAHHANDAISAVEKYFRATHSSFQRHITVPTPAILQSILSEGSTIATYSGDGGVQLLVGAATGIIPNDMDATSNFLSQQTALLAATKPQHVVLPGGFANNIARSVNPRLGKNFKFLEQSSKYTTLLHKPLFFRVYNERDDITQSGIANSGFGVGDPARIMHSVEHSKQELTQLPRLLRSATSAGIAIGSLWTGKKFNAVVNIIDELDESHAVYNGNATGFEFAGSQIYADNGRLRNVAIGEATWQPIITEYHPKRSQRAGTIAMQGLRLASGFSKLDAVSMENKKLEIKIDGEQPVFFHNDGEIDEHKVIMPGGRVVLAQAKLAVPLVRFL